uniref:Uncharacterized protein n=1 Tax=Candidatus Kentrum sp. FM TaxID=2126340 RepID=A0A450RV03_9GAMM|nr:MAG: hypothetical protein BECKFM1743A_GA0114220_1000222 [Candidatus Kentron sp. FM]VFJ43544.1 MAG: hypothetical protein BECKFM1743C_GA0114222_1000222 [Candidatus Kentron sp. FM]VFK05587.1 MAG: hypothetical protein BECKFM1743B_GA0114221_1000222 [Candidatus Kentron sp. FM]
MSILSEFLTMLGVQDDFCIQLMGEITAGRILFGDKDIEPILGVTALESVGILVDPANKTLRRLPAIPLK